MRCYVLLLLALVWLAGCSEGEVPVGRLSASRFEQRYAALHEFGEESSAASALRHVTRIWGSPSGSIVRAVCFPDSDRLVGYSLDVSAEPCAPEKRSVLSGLLTVGGATGSALSDGLVADLSEQPDGRLAFWYVDPWNPTLVKCTPLADQARKKYPWPPTDSRSAGSAPLLEGLLAGPDSREVHAVHLVQTHPRRQDLSSFDVASRSWVHVRTCQELVVQPKLLGGAGQQELRVFGIRFQTPPGESPAFVALSEDGRAVASDTALQVSWPVPYGLAEDTDGTAHLFYQAMSPRGGWILMHSWEQGAGWRHEVVDNLHQWPEQAWACPSAVQGSNGQLHVAYFACETSSVRHARRSHSGWHITEVAEAGDVWSLALVEAAGRMVVMWADGAKRRFFCRVLPSAEGG